MASNMRSSDQQQKLHCGPLEMLMRLILFATETHFSTPGVFDERRMSTILLMEKTVMEKTQKEAESRHALGLSPSLWSGLTGTFFVAIPVLERLSFAAHDSVSPDYNGASSTLVALNYVTLLDYIERLNDLCMIARNLLATTSKAQNLAADTGFDQQILKLIDLCVRVTARGFDGESETPNEEKWQKIVTSYKKLLVTSLQFLHNLVMHNEHRKLLLWLDLFGNSLPADPYLTNSNDTQREIPALSDKTNAALAGSEASPESDQLADLRDIQTALEQLSDSDQKVRDVSADKAALLEARTETSKGPRDSALAQLNTIKAARKGSEAVLESKPGVNGQADKDASMGAAILPQTHQWNWTNLPDSTLYSSTENNVITAEDMKIARTPQSAAMTLQAAKEQLMVRLQEAAQSPAEGKEEERRYLTSEHGQSAEGEEADVRGSDVAGEGSVDDDEDEDDYRGPGDQERGLLTDIPLILGPTEIEALPMIIQAGIVDGFGPRPPGSTGETQKMQAVRCNILLAQEAGRNLLRELLIFIAAWDLTDDEFYFKMMQQIMEAILQNGLMPFAYQTFGEVKDIVSPAQSVVMKLLTQIFRVKNPPMPGSTQPPASQRLAAPTRVEVLIVRYIFTVFRQSIIPETCALIYLQGQIRAGNALAEDFPLNLWDMERVYEGVYQFLEFFAVLTEHDYWKSLLVKWEIVSELVTLLRELDAGIPKAPLPPRTNNPPPAATSPSAGANSNNSTTSQPTQLIQNAAPAPTPAPAPTSTVTPVAVERPYDPSPPDPSTDPNHPDANLHSTSPASQSPHLDGDNGIGVEDPSTFEWRNLKKLVVLVLSSLVWKSTMVQDQVRRFGGVEMVLNCCNFDANNPYIREHAIMCLRFLLEGNRENQKVVEGLEARGVRVVDREGVLERRGLEGYVAEGGKVAVRRKENEGGGG